MLARVSPTALAAFTAVTWGTIWLPSRWLDETAGGALWAWTLAYLLPFALLLPLLARRGAAAWRHGRLFWLAAASCALAAALYAEAVLRGEVARVLLLFHVAVVWSTLMGWRFLGETIGRRRVLAIVLGLCGLVSLFGLDQGLPVPRSTADWMALVAGVSWSAALTALRVLPHVDDTDKTLATAAMLALAFPLLALVPGGRVAGAVDATLLLPVLGIGLLMAVLWLLPVLWVTMHVAGRLSPGRLSVILLLEIAVGIASAALWADEIPGPREWLAMLFITAAILAEVMPLPARRAVA